MKPALSILLLPIAALAAAVDAPRATERIAVADATLPMYTPDGFRSMLVTGSMDFSNGGREAFVTDMQLTAYSGDASERVVSILIAPEATVVRATENVSGEKLMRLIRYDLNNRADLQATSVKWSYNNRDKSVSLKERVKVTFQAELKDIFK